MDQEVNGETLTPVWGWHWGRYLITTDSDRALSLADAVTIAKIDAQKEGNG